MCPWVGSHVPSCGRQLWGPPGRVEYLSPQGVLLPRVYGTTASPLWLKLRGPTGWQATPSWAVCRHPCHQLLPWLRATFAVVPRCSLARLGPLGLEYRSCHWPGGSAGLPQCVRPWGCRPLRACACAVCWPAWRLFTSAHAVCRLRVLSVVASPLLPPPNILYFSFLFFILYSFSFFSEI